MAEAAKHDGGPAFPHATEEVWAGEVSTSRFYGMSLRDWFAGQALVGDLASTPNCRPSIKGSAERAYAYADAMLAARAEGKGA